MLRLLQLHARELLDSRGNPTVEVSAKSARLEVSAIVPSGASTGTHEALELRDKNPKRFFGKGVLKAVRNVNTIISKKLCGVDLLRTGQRRLDEILISLDGTENKSRLGANAILGVSLACAKLAALEKRMPLFEYLAATYNIPSSPHRDTAMAGHKTFRLPLPLMNIINGGVHADSGLEFQEMMIVPAGAPNFHEAVRMGAEIFHSLKKILAEKGFSVTVGDEGGFAPRLASHEAALDLIMKAIEKAHYRAGRDVFLALDVASSEFCSPARLSARLPATRRKSGKDPRGTRYELKIRGKKKKVETPELIDYYAALAKKYPIVSIEDGCAEDDWEGWKLLTQKLGGKIQLVGDDLFVTNSARLKTGIDRGIANAILVKLNQIGTLTETVDVITQAQVAGYATIVSHRSGETEDTFISHLAVGLQTGQIKTGSLSRSERIAKYNELLRIEEMLGRRARFGARKVYKVYNE